MPTSALRWSATFPVPVEDAFDATLVVALDDILGTRHLVVPAVTRVEQDAAWGSAGVGQQRVLHLGGGSLRETLTLLDRPRAFGYTLDQVHGPMRALATSVHGRWDFEPAGTGTRTTWTWDLVPATPATRLLEPAFAVAWRGAARRAFDRLEAHLLA